MSLHTLALPPKIFAVWIRTLRVASDMSQDALAEASGISQRTIQRIESNGRANRMTRRSLARGFGYADHDIFDDPTFIATATDVLAKIYAERAKEEKAKYPDHIELAVELVSSGAQISGLIDRCDAWVYDCDDSASVKGKNVSAVLFDNIQDYGEIWSELSSRERLEARDAFTEMLAEITSQGLCAYQAFRSASLPPIQADKATRHFNIGYIMLRSTGQIFTHFLVPKRIDWRV
jgi:transcriptional regulator with XRE-family HTH domain